MIRRFLAVLLFTGFTGVVSVHALGQEENGPLETDLCQQIGFEPRTEAFGECVLTLLERQAGSKSPQPPALALVAPIPAIRAPAVLTAREPSVPAARLPVAPVARLASAPATQVATAQTAARVVTLPPPQMATVPTSAINSRQTHTSVSDATCSQYGFQRGTNEFASCVMQLDQAAQLAQAQERQYQLQLQQYQQQMAAYEAQRQELERQRRREETAAFFRGAANGVNSGCRGFLDCLAVGAATELSGVTIPPPPQQPQRPPSIQYYTLRTANGSTVNCTFLAGVNHMDCR